MSATRSARASEIPDLQFAVEGARSLQYAAVPTLVFALRINVPDGHSVRSVLLDVQIQIAARQRGYEPQAKERLLELFGVPERWGTTLRTLPWLRTTVVVPPFTESTVVDLTVPVSYDTEVTAARYLAALDDGMIPLELLFSGSVFFTGPTGLLQTSRISWEREVDFRLPVATWREAMDRHFPDSAWLRLGTDVFNRLSAYKAEHASLSWDDAIAQLLEASR